MNKKCKMTASGKHLFHTCASNSESTGTVGYYQTLVKQCLVCGFIDDSNPENNGSGIETYPMCKISNKIIN